MVDRWEAESLAEGDQEARYRDDVLPVKLAIDGWYVRTASPALDLTIAWSLVERFVLGRPQTAVERIVRREVPEASAVPVAGRAGG